MNQEARNRLRELANKSHYNGLMHIPHNTILELLDENERMREALEAIAEKWNPDASSRQYWKDCYIDSVLTIVSGNVKTARQALGEVGG